ncbi:MAG: 2-oxoacid:acceptor oxidoreductase subunit alpha [Chitinophagales bacterium]|nr:2-oxoacid:acceptor oxidoreductase subunit alpha [Bacteroidota bacterium]
MSKILVNDLVVRFSNVNGTGSASANELFAKAVFRMKVPATPKNIFPSNIQGLPTWFDVRISEKGYLGRREEIDILVCVNPQSMERDIASVRTGGYFIFDNTKNLPEQYLRADIHYLGIPMIELSRQNYDNPRQQQLFKNIIYVGALAWLLNIDIEVVKGVVAEQFAQKEKLIPPNFKALELGANYAKNTFKKPLDLQVKSSNVLKDEILIDGNTACALGALYAGATVMAWYPITPSTSIAKAFETYCKKFRKDPVTGKNNFAFVQAEDELAAIGMVIGAAWNGVRAFTATSGPGVSLMSEFIGLSYFAEVPVVLINVERGGPSTGMPTRTQQADILSSAYASHGDTKHILLFPATPLECFELTAMAFDLADRLQTTIMVMTDLDLGMNPHISPPLQWDDSRKYDLGKVLSAEDLENLQEKYGRYRDVDGDGIPYRTLPGTHPTLGAYFTRGTSHTEYARYTESGEEYVRNMNRLLLKWETAKTLLPAPDIQWFEEASEIGILFFGTTNYVAFEALDLLNEQNIHCNSMRIKAFPFQAAVQEFIDRHQIIFVIEQNRDAQFRTLLINELNVSPQKLVSVLHYDGTPMTAEFIYHKIQNHISIIA